MLFPGSLTRLYGVQHITASTSSRGNHAITTQCFVCVGCDIVQSDHAPEAGVAQGIVHGDLVRHRKNQEEVEVGLEEEVERETRGRRHSRTSAHVDDHGWNEDTQMRLEPM